MDRSLRFTRRRLLRHALVLSLVVGSVGVATAATPGTQLWARRYDGPSGGPAFANAAAVSPDGSTVFVTGTEANSLGVGNYATLAYDALAGARLWLKRYDGPGGSNDDAQAVAASPDGSTVFVTGGSEGSAGTDDFATLAYDATSGTTLWVKRYDGPSHGDDVAVSAAVSPDGSTVFVTGRSRGATSGRDFATVAYDTSTGSEIWAKRYTGAGDGIDDPHAVAVSPDASLVFVLGDSEGASGNSDYATIAYGASSGARLWVRRFDRGSPATFRFGPDLGVSPDGSQVFVTGTGIGASGTLDYITLAYGASTGATQWSKRYAGAAGRADVAFASDVSPDGSIVAVTGYESDASGVADYATVAYDASSGVRLWRTRYAGPGDGYDVPHAIGVSPDGTKVFVSGFSLGAGTSGDDIATVAYDASTGAKLWVRRYAGPGGADDAYSLAVSPLGTSVFIVGPSTGATGDYDFVTIAYAT